MKDKYTQTIKTMIRGRKETLFVISACLIKEQQKYLSAKSGDPPIQWPLGSPNMIQECTLYCYHLQNLLEYSTNTERGGESVLNNFTTF